MTSQLTKRSVVIHGNQTSVSLEDRFWQGLKEIAGAQRMTLSDLITPIARERRGNLSSAIRQYVRENYRALGESGSKRA